MKKKLLSALIGLQFFSPIECATDYDELLEPSSAVESISVRKKSVAPPKQEVKTETKEKSAAEAARDYKEELALKRRTAQERTEDKIRAAEQKVIDAQRKEKKDAQAAARSAARGEKYGATGPSLTDRLKDKVSDVKETAKTKVEEYKEDSARNKKQAQERMAKTASQALKQAKRAVSDKVVDAMGSSLEKIKKSIADQALAAKKQSPFYTDEDAEEPDEAKPFDAAEASSDFDSVLSREQTPENKTNDEADNADDELISEPTPTITHPATSKVAQKPKVKPAEGAQGYSLEDEIADPTTQQTLEELYGIKDTPVESEGDESSIFDDDGPVPYL